MSRTLFVEYVREVGVKTACDLAECNEVSPSLIDQWVDELTRAGIIGPSA